jgi:hypothetical protein
VLFGDRIGAGLRQPLQVVPFFIAVDGIILRAPAASSQTFKFIDRSYRRYDVVRPADRRQRDLDAGSGNLATLDEKKIVLPGKNHCLAFGLNLIGQSPAAVNLKGQIPSPAMPPTDAPTLHQRDATYHL